MAKQQLYKTAQYAIKLHQMIGNTDNLEPWIQSKITKAADYMSSIKHYLEYEQVNPHEEESPMDMVPNMESSDARVKQGVERIFDSAQNELASSLEK